MPDILQHARNYFQKSAMPTESVSLPTLMQASFQRVAEKLIQIDKIYYFLKIIARFACVCAFFVVPLQHNLKSKKNI